MSVLISFKTKTDIESQEIPCSTQTSDVHEVRRLVIKGLELEIQLQSSAVEDAGQSSQDKCKSSKHRAKWKETFHNVEELGMLVKEKKNTWSKM